MDGDGKTPIWIDRPDGELFAFAGVWAELPSREKKSDPLHEDELLALLVPAPEDALVAREVGDFVNDVRDDGSHLIEKRAQAQPQLF